MESSRFGLFGSKDCECDETGLLLEDSVGLRFTEGTLLKQKSASLKFEGDERWPHCLRTMSRTKLTRLLLLSHFMDSICNDDASHAPKATRFKPFLVVSLFVLKNRPGVFARGSMLRPLDSQCCPDRGSPWAGIAQRVSNLGRGFELHFDMFSVHGREYRCRRVTMLVGT